MASTRDTPAAPETGRLSFADLPGWAEDDLAAATAAYALTCDRPLPSGDMRRALEGAFRPGPAIPAHVTGYYEPELSASLAPSDEYGVPLHALPPGGCTLPRGDVDAALVGQEIAWLRDEVDRFFLQVQGSGRLALGDGSVLRVGYAGRNGHPYRSIGRLLIAEGIFGPDITADALKEWLRRDAARGRAVMNRNPSYVFFRLLDVPADRGPTGAMGQPVTAGRSLAVDPDHIALGSLVWLEAAGMARLCVAQDVGSAIKGAGRVDLFLGTGDDAGRAAGRLNDTGRLIPLVPR
ncbi:MltA domain-containing protein [Jannaschia sp. 2305UL9-9]|uniref:MltA domain-containing protein n=1 Tax=Jannaschia sp. 2305UL9-9 TaxID=3121638 RepID=UPI00352956EB